MLVVFLRGWQQVMSLSVVAPRLAEVRSKVFGTYCQPLYALSLSFPDISQLVVEFADVRILAFGVLNAPRSPLTVNRNARRLLQPPGVYPSTTDAASIRSGDTASTANTRCGLSIPSKSSIGLNLIPFTAAMEPMSYPHPMPSHTKYPLFTPGGKDKRWLSDVSEDGSGRQWVGGMLLCAQLCSAETRTHFGELPLLQDLDLVVGPGRSRFTSFLWEDFDAIAPWLSGHIGKRINGQGLGM